MKRYLAFAWNPKHGPHGGADDYIGSADSVEEAVKLFPTDGKAIGNILDLETERVLPWWP